MGKRLWFRRFLLISMAIALVNVLTMGTASAQGGGDGPALADLAMAIDTVWLLIAGFLVFFMQAGFSFLEAGLVRSKNVGNILAETFVDTAISGISFFAFGFAIMFGAGNGLFGTQYFFLTDLPGADTWGVPPLAFFFFQYAFAAAAATIASGAMAERTDYKADLIYSFFVSGFIYPIVGHWIWSGDGWLAGLGFRDFAGSTVVHSTGAWVALMGALFLGARRGRIFGKGGPGLPSHSMTLVTLGTFILWLGWFGFNPGSTIAATGEATFDIALIVVTTNLAACAGTFVGLVLGWMQTGRPQLPWAINGTLAGLVAITASCAFVTPLESVIIGAVGAVAMYIGLMVLENLKIDDPVAAVPVHGFAGVWGTIAVGLFAAEGGLLHGGSVDLLVAQVIGIGAVMAFAMISAAILFTTIKATIGLRVSAEGEDMGLDLYLHDVPTYPEFTEGTPAPARPESEVAVGMATSAATGD